MVAFETVLQDIARRGIKRIFCLGDIVGKGPYSEKAVDLCRQECEVVIKGNWDFHMNQDIPDLQFKWHREKLGAERLAYLEKLPNNYDFYCSGHKVRLFHASQAGVMARVHMRDAEEKHLAMFTNTDFTGYRFEPDVVGCADIHAFYMRNFRNKVLFNTGSVGNPLDFTQAAYVIMEGEMGSPKEAPFSLTMVRLPYDIDLAIRQAREQRIPDFEAFQIELNTAVYRGLHNKK